VLVCGISRWCMSWSLHAWYRVWWILLTTISISSTVVIYVCVLWCDRDSDRWDVMNVLHSLFIYIYTTLQLSYCCERGSVATLIPFNLLYCYCCRWHRLYLQDDDDDDDDDKDEWLITHALSIIIASLSSKIHNRLSCKVCSVTNM